MSTIRSIHDELLSKFVVPAKRLLSGDDNDENGEEVSKCKIAKIDSDENGLSLKDLQFTRFLRVSPKAKRICIECKFNGAPAIVLLEKSAFEEEITKCIVANFSDSLANVKNLFRNDIYGTYLMDIVLNDLEREKNNLNQIFMTIIHPARPKDIEKYLEHSVYLVRETPDLYEKVTKPYVQSQVNTAGHLQWLYNILEHKAEVDRIVYEENLDNDNGFILVQDMKWKHSSDELTDIEKSEIYINALVTRRDLYTLRDLTPEHLPMLDAIYNRGRKAIADKYSMSPQELRVFVHYQPSFFHLHVHFTHIKAENGGFQAERAHLLSTVMENIRLLPDYYKRVTLEFPLSTASELKHEQYD